MFALRISCLVCFMSLLLIACETPDDQDLENFINENKRRPPGSIQEAPNLEAYDSFTYDAYRLRSPFEKPITIEEQEVIVANSNVRPDFLRQRERLEQYDLSALSMVGTLERDNQRWALISDPDGGIERVQVGNYIGRNHGKITSVTQTKIDLVEIVASGTAWLERPNILQIRVANSQ